MYDFANSKITIKFLLKRSTMRNCQKKQVTTYMEMVGFTRETEYLGR